MPTHRSKRAIAQVLRYAWIVEDGRLHDAGWEDYFIASWIVVCLMSRSDVYDDGDTTRATRMRPRTLTVSAVIPHSSRFVGLPRADHSRSTVNFAMERAFPKKAVLVMLTSA